MAIPNWSTLLSWHLKLIHGPCVWALNQVLHQRKSQISSTFSSPCIYGGINLPFSFLATYQSEQYLGEWNPNRIYTRGLASLKRWSQYISCSSWFGWGWASQIGWFQESRWPKAKYIECSRFPMSLCSGNPCLFFLGIGRYTGDGNNFLARVLLVSDFPYSMLSSRYLTIQVSHKRVCQLKRWPIDD